MHMLRRLKKLKVIQKELAKAQKEKEKQYTTMKRRIKYMYENGNQEYLDIIFGAKSISDLLNRSEYVEKISEYDNKVFAHFKKAALTVQQKEKQREQQTNELKELETKTREEKQAVSELKADKKTELDKIDKAMEKSQDQVSEYTKKRWKRKIRWKHCFRKNRMRLTVKWRQAAEIPAAAQQDLAYC